MNVDWKYLRPVFVSFITSWDWTDQDLRLVIPPHVSPEILLGRERSPALLTPKLLLVSVFFLSEFFLPVRHFSFFLHVILNYSGRGGEIHTQTIPDGGWSDDWAPSVDPKLLSEVR